MLDALQHIANRDEHNKLRWLNADKKRDCREERCLDNVIEEMIAVVRPQRHLLLTVMNRVQLPPHAKTMLPSVIPVARKIQDHQIEQERHDRLIGHAGPDIIDVNIRYAVDRNQALPVIEQRLQQEEETRD